MDETFYHLTIKSLFSNRIIVTIMLLLEFVDIIISLNNEFGPSNNIFRALFNLISPMNWYDFFKKYFFTQTLVSQDICNTENNIVVNFISLLSNDTTDRYIYDDNLVML